VTPSSPGRRFAPQWHWTLLALAGIALFASLGRWQLHRAEEKRALFEGFAAGNLEAVDLPGGLTPVERYRRVRASGRYDAGRQFLLDNMPRDGVPGVHVLTPLVRDDGSVVIVDRGWIAIGGDRAALPALPVNGAPRTVTGRAAAVHPQVLLLDEEQPEGFVRDWRPPGMTPDKHVGYAIQWFGLAAAVAGTWLVLSFRPGKESK
jgi:surfeit locus 1 family protein